MADRKQFLATSDADDELLTLLRTAQNREVTEEELHEQRISFAYGNAMNSDEITKETVRNSSQHIRLRA